MLGRSKLPCMPADWQDTATAIGTIAVAVVAVGVALYGERRADSRIKQERIYAAKVLADERAAADGRLLEQMKHSDAQLREERQRSQQAAQLAEAWAVEVAPRRYDKTASTTELAVNVKNLGSYAITEVDAWFSPDGQNLVHRAGSEHIGEFKPRESGPAAFERVSDFDSHGYGGVIIRGTAMRFWSDEISKSNFVHPFPVVRWKDYMGQRWEHRQGRVRMVAAGEAWTL